MKECANTIDQWLKEGRCDISAELTSIGFLDPNLTDISKIIDNQVGYGAF